MAEQGTAVEADPAQRRSFAADADIVEFLVSRTRCLTLAPVTDAVRAPGGNVSPGVLITLFDMGASRPAMVACDPDWTATQDLSLHGADPVVEGPIVIDSRLVRAGKKVIVVSGEVYDGHGVDDLEKLQHLIDQGAEGLTRAASGLLSFARLPRTAAPGMDDYDPASWVGEVRRAVDVAAPAVLDPLHERLGLRVLDAATGQVELHRTPYVTNSIGTILGGVQAVMVEAAAEAMRQGTVATDVQIRFLSQVKAGPARTTGRIVRDAADHSVVVVELVDAGHDDQLLALATVTVRPA